VMMKSFPEPFECEFMLFNKKLFLNINMLNNLFIENRHVNK
jgi:hypothetical protein